jgi:ABC-type branched-subunit amino acid transport system ATPase component
VVPGATLNHLVTSIYFVPILSGLGAINVAQEPDGILTLIGHRHLKVQDGPPSRTSRRLRLIPGQDRANDRIRSLDAAVAPLELRGVSGGYNGVDVVHEVNLRLRDGSVTALLGANGAGKSTLCGIVAGTLAPSRGEVLLYRQPVTMLAAYARARLGLFHIPEVRGVFPRLTVEENLIVALPAKEHREQAYDRFPVLGERRHRPAGLLSGGEQQMLSLAPALVVPPSVLIADEPTLGLAPLVAEAVTDAILEISRQGCTVLLVEEHARNARQIATDLAVMELGRIVWNGAWAEADIELLTRAYLGGGRVVAR